MPEIARKIDCQVFCKLRRNVAHGGDRRQSIINEMRIYLRKHQRAPLSLYRFLLLYINIRVYDERADRESHIGQREPMHKVIDYDSRNGEKSIKDKRKS